jgi:hypothetical protein
MKSIASIACFPKLPAPNRLIRPTNTLAHIFYPFRSTQPLANRACKTHSSPASAAPAASYKSPYRKCAGVMRLGPPQMFLAGTLVDRILRFFTTRASFRQAIAKSLSLPPLLLAVERKLLVLRGVLQGDKITRSVAQAGLEDSSSAESPSRGIIQPFWPLR